ncbi:MAG: hypothetical protein PHH86_06650 [Sphaerochaetaceae bacterium]|nr:hypothetical protein [Sphaerochaetaceae bacterium]
MNKKIIWLKTVFTVNRERRCTSTVEFSCYNVRPAIVLSPGWVPTIKIILDRRMVNDSIILGQCVVDNRLSSR